MYIGRCEELNDTMSTMRASILLAAMTALLLAAGYMIGAEQGMVIAFSWRWA